MKTNLDPKIESALCYIPFVGWIVAIVMLIIEKNPDVRFNAAQSLILSVASWVVMLVLGITLILAVLTPLVWLAVLVLDIVLLIKAYQGQKMVLPVIGDWAKTLLGKVSSK